MINRRSEEKLGSPLPERKIGGVAGGGSQLTQPGKQFLKQYGQFRKETEGKLEEVFHKYFGQSFLVHQTKKSRR